MERRRILMTYRPLPKDLTIKKSKIEGLGLFATEDIPSGVELGLSHIVIGRETFRTPLGGFINHDIAPNCVKVKRPYFASFRIYKTWKIKTIANIQKGDELTLQYEWYKPIKQE